jgi:hypothetical protein
VKKFKLGPALDPSTTHGPLIHQVGRLVALVSQWAETDRFSLPLLIHSARWTRSTRSTQTSLQPAPLSLFLPCPFLLLCFFRRRSALTYPFPLLPYSSVQDAIAHGAKLVLGGKRATLDGALANGFFYEPTILTEVPTSGVALNQEETFGPVAGLSRFDNEDELIKIANDTEVGLAGCTSAPSSPFPRIVLCESETPISQSSVA